MKMYLGIDVGGTNVKAIALNAEGEKLAFDKIPTAGKGGENLVIKIVEIANKLREQTGADQVGGVGVGCPGVIDSASGTVIFSGNLQLKKFPLGERLKEVLGCEVRVINDANAAALGEAKFGAGKNYEDSILITLGTGVGGGVMLDGKLFEGHKSAGTELGHMVIIKDGIQCACGRRGCFERYASATALTNLTREAMMNNRGSAMWSKYTPETCDGATPFAFPGDEAADRVVEEYLKKLACGIVNLANIFRPQAVMIGGGVSAQGERLTVPLQKLVDKEIYGGQDYAPVKVVEAKLRNEAGSYGAASLVLGE